MGWTRKLVLAKVVVVFLLLIPLGISVVNAEGVWSPGEAAESLASDLLAANTARAVEVLLLELLELLDIGVFARDGSIVLASDSVVSEEDFYLYDFQVRILAEQFIDRRYQPLQDIMALWQEVGIVVLPEGERTYIPIDGVIVEKELRSLRHWAEKHPDEPSGFVVRLIDALGNRDVAPFDLLAERPDDEYEPPGGASPGQQMQDRMRDAFETAVEGEDLGDEFDMDAVFAAMLTGDLAKIVEAAAGAEAAAEMKEGLAEAEAELRQRPESAEDDSPLTEEWHAMQMSALELATSIFDGNSGVQDLFHQVMAQQEEQRDMLDRYQRELAERWQQEARERERDLNENDTDAGDLAAASWANFEGIPLLLDSQWAFQQAEETVERMQEELELSEVEQEWQERRIAAYPTDEEDPPRSTLVLDPIQSLLVQLDLLMPPHDEDDVAVRQTLGSFSPVLLMVQSSQRPGLGGELLGILNDRLESAIKSEITDLVTDAAGEGFKRLKKRLDIPGKVLDILHGVMVMMAHTTTVEVKYHPDDAVLGEGIRLRSSAERRAAEREKRYIEVKVTVTFDPPEAAQAVEWGRMRTAQFVQYTIPGTLPWLMGNQVLDKLSDLQFPEPGPRENIAVQLRYGADLREHVVLDVADWFQPALMLVLTDENGEASVRFYLEEEAEPAATWGGRPYWEFGEAGATIRVHPLTQVQDGGTWTYQEVAFGVADWLQGVTGIGATDVPIHIERLEYVPWEGTVRFERMVVVSVEANSESPLPDDRFGIRTTRYYSLDDWVLKATSPELLLVANTASPTPTSQEHSAPLWDINLSGSHLFQEIQEYWSRCTVEGHTECLTTHERDFAGRAEEDLYGGVLTARPVVSLHTAAGRYKVNLTMMPAVAGAVLRPTRNVDAIIDCEGTHRDAQREQELQRVHSMIRPEVLVLMRTGLHDFPDLYDERWFAFDRDMDSLTNTLNWASRIPNVSFTYRARPTVHVHNVLRWEFSRDLRPVE